MLVFEQVQWLYIIITKALSVHLADTGEVLRARKVVEVCLTLSSANNTTKITRYIFLLEEIFRKSSNFPWEYTSILMTIDISFSFIVSSFSS